MTRPALYLVPTHRDAERPPPSAAALLRARIERMDDDTIARVVARLCEELAREDERIEEERESQRNEVRRAVERDLRDVEARLLVTRDHGDRARLMRMRDRAREALKGGA